MHLFSASKCALPTAHRMLTRTQQNEIVLNAFPARSDSSESLVGETGCFGQIPCACNFSLPHQKRLCRVSQIRAPGVTHGKIICPLAHLSGRWDKSMCVKMVPASVCSSRVSLSLGNKRHDDWMWSTDVLWFVIIGRRKAKSRHWVFHFPNALYFRFVMLFFDRTSWKSGKSKSSTLINRSELSICFKIMWALSSWFWSANVEWIPHTNMRCLRTGNPNLSGVFWNLTQMITKTNAANTRHNNKKLVQNQKIRYGRCYCVPAQSQPQPDTLQILPLQPADIFQPLLAL